MIYYFNLLEYGPVQIKIEDDINNENFVSTCCMVKDEPSENELNNDSLLTVPEPSINDSLTRHNLNLSLLSPRSEDNCQIPSPCNIQYETSLRSPIYPRYTDRPSPVVSPSRPSYAKTDDFIGISMNRNYSIYNTQPPELLRSFLPSHRLNHDFESTAHRMNTIKTETCDTQYREPTRGKQN